MSDTNPLSDLKRIEAGQVKMVLQPTSVPGRDVVYQVIIQFPLESLRVYTSKWANPLRVALEAADEALNELKCEIFNEELNEGKPMMKTREDAQQDMVIATALAKDEEKKDA